MTSPTSDQHDRAALLAECLTVSGHDDIDTLDLLDALASTGLRLAWDMHDVVSATYTASVIAAREEK